MQNMTSGWNVGSLHLVVCFNWKMSRFNWVMLKLKMSHPCNVTSLCCQMWPKSPKMFHLVCVYCLFSTSKCCVGAHERFFFLSLHPPGLSLLLQGRGVKQKPPQSWIVGQQWIHTCSTRCTVCGHRRPLSSVWGRCSHLMRLVAVCTPSV